jgi:hypothetical protein
LYVVNCLNPEQVLFGVLAIHHFGALHMHYIKLLLMIAIISGKRIVRRLVRPTIETAPIDRDIMGWVRMMETCDDHAIITSYARSTFT